jgi:HEAT repeat protein
MGLCKITFCWLVGFLALLPLLFANDSSESPKIESSQILYLMQSGNMAQALDVYKEYRKEIGHHDCELLQQLSLILLDQGHRNSDPEIQLLTIFGAGISSNEKALYILQDGINNSIPELQMVCLNFLARHQNDSAEEALKRAMASDYLLIRLEAAFHLAERKAPHAVAQTEALMYKVDEDLLFLFPQLFAAVGNAEAMRIMRRLLTDSDEQVRIETILCSAESRRDDLLPKIRMLATHHEVGQQEACAYALGEMKDEKAVPKLEKLARSNTPTVRLAALRALYRMGRKEMRFIIEEGAQKENLFAIQVLGEIEGSEDTLFKLTQSPNIHVKINAALALLDHSDPRCLSPLLEIFIKDSRDLGFLKASSQGKAFTAWKVVPSARQNFAENPVAFELSLNMREETLRKTLDLPEKDFIQMAHLIFETGQNDLVPTLVQLLENLQTPAAIELLKKHQQKAGAPLIRNYCNLSLFLLKEPGPYADNLMDWVVHKQNEDFIRFRTFVPWELRESHSFYQLTPQETSNLLIRSFEAFAQTQEDRGIDLLIEAIQHGNPKNKYALAGLLMRAAE